VKEKPRKTKLRISLVVDVGDTGDYDSTKDAVLEKRILTVACVDWGECSVLRDQH